MTDIRNDAAKETHQAEVIDMMTPAQMRDLVASNAHRLKLQQDELDELRPLRLERRQHVDDGGEWPPPAITSYGASFNPADIPRRRWCLGHRRALGEVTIDVGPPGVNKSTLLLMDAVAIASNRQLLADPVHRSGDVLLFAGEDSRRDVEARLAGILQRFRVTPEELGDRLHVIYLGEIDALHYSFAQMIMDVAVLNNELLRWVADFPELVAAFIDPIAAWHHVLENDNGAMKVLSTGLRRMAVMGNVHVGLDHHVNKASMGDPEAHVGNLAATRGAFLAGDARWMFTLAKLRPESAAAFGVAEDERRRWRRLDPLKASYGPDDGDARLFYIENVPIANGEEVGVMVERDATQARAAAADRKEAVEQARRIAQAAAFARMLTEKRPRSVANAAAWMQSHHPELFVGPKGKPLGYASLRACLPQVIGTGLDTDHGRVVISESRGRGASQEIDFAQTGLPIA